MVLKFDSFDEIREYVNKKETPVVIYGAGMIGQIIMPYIVVEYGIVDKLLFYVDGDSKKKTKLSILEIGILKLSRWMFFQIFLRML